MERKFDPGRRVYQLRVAKGMSQEHVARMAGLPCRAYVSRYETGERDMRPDLLKRMAAVLGTSVEYILTGEDEPQHKVENLSPKTLKIVGRPKGRTTISMYPETADTIHWLSRMYGLTTADLMVQLMDHCMACLDLDASGGNT